MSESWTTEESEVLISDRWIHLRRQRVVTPKGAVLDPYYVLTYSDWAVSVALTGDGRVVLVRQYRHGTGTVSLELPGGCVDHADATPHDAALRELAEETGYGGGVATYLGGLAANPALQTNRLHVSVVTGVEPLHAQALEPGEELTVVLMPVAEAVALATSGGMEQSMHVAALLMGLTRLGLLALAE